MISSFFFFNDTATTEIYTLSLHDALPISTVTAERFLARKRESWEAFRTLAARMRSEEHTSELQSLTNLVCRLLLEKKNWLHLPRTHCSEDAQYNTVVHRVRMSDVTRRM